MQNGYNLVTINDYAKEKLKEFKANLKHNFDEKQVIESINSIYLEGFKDGTDEDERFETNKVEKFEGG